MTLKKIRRFLGAALFILTCAFLLPDPARAAIGIDASVSADQGSAKTTVSVSPLSTVSSNELLLAFVSTDYKSGTGSNAQVNSISGGGLTWAFVVRANAQSGTAEVWRAFAPAALSNVTVTATLSQSVASSMTVMSFTGVDTSGSNGSGAIGATNSAGGKSGAPTVSLTTTRNGSWVFAVGNDFDFAIARTPGAGQSLVHQDLAPVGDTYWVQMQNSVTALSGTNITINDTAPTGDRYNLAAVEILALAGSGGGSPASITPTSGGGQSATVGTAFGAPLVATVKDSGGNPVSSVTVTFAAPGSGASGTFTGGNTATTNSSGVATSGAFTANSVAGGPYTVTAAVGGVATPANFSLTNVAGTAASSVTPTSGGGQSATEGTAFAAPLVATVKDSGGNPVSGVTVTFAAPGSGASGTFTGGNTAITNSSGVATSGTFTANSIAGGPYTVTATVGGVATPANFALTNTPGPPNTITPTSGGGQSATVGTAFGAPLVATVKDSGGNAVSGATVTFAAPGSGASGTFAGGNTATTNSSGVATSGTFTANSTAGSYTVTASVSGVATPASFTLTNNNAGAAALAIDATVSKDNNTASNTIVSPTFSTGSGNELLLAFVSSDYQKSQSSTNVTVTGVSGGGLAWVLVNRTNTQAGTAEIWRAFAPSALSNVTVTATLSQSVQSSMTVMSFMGVDTTGTNGSGAIGAIGSGNASTGAPTATLVTTRNNSWVVGSGNDYDNAIARTLGPGQTMVHQDLSPIKDTYWVQRQSSATALSGTSVTINDTAPTGDRYNLSIAEVLPSSNSAPTTYNLSGTISPAASGNGSTVTLTGASTGTLTATADSNGNFMFTGLANGTYTVTPTKSNFSFVPASQNVSVSGANVTGILFTAQTTGSPSIKLVQSNVNGNEAGTSNMSVSFNSSNTAGNFLIVTGTAARPASTLTISDTLGNSYTAAMGPVTDTVQNVTVYIWYVANCKGGASTVTITPSGTAALEIHVSEWSGLAASSTVDQIASNTGTGTSVSSGPQTTTANGELIFGYGWVLNTASAGAGFTPISLVNGDLDEYQIQPASGSIAATFTQTSGTWFAAMVTFKPTGGTSGNGLNVSMVSPAPNAIVTSMTNVSASATDLSNSITGVQFLLDGNNLGTQVTSAPYSITWDTSTTTAGTHTLSAIAHDSAGQNTTAASLTVTVDKSGNPAVVGTWSSPISTPAVAVNLILLKNNKLLFYQDGSTPTVWDYVNNIFTNIPVAVDLFCSGQTALSDGRILMVGGHGASSTQIGIPSAEIFDPTNNSWTTLPNMAYSRWYPNATALSDGRAIVMGGWQTTSHSNAGIPEIYNPTTNQWTQLNSANNPFESYPFVYQLSDGRLIHVGGSEFATDTETLNLTTQTWTVMDARILDGGSASMYSPGKIMKAGSATDSQNVGPSSNTTFVLDTTQASPVWQQTASMAYARSFLNLTTLPDGTVLATGGESDKNGGNISNAVYAAELWSPQTMTWTTMAAMHTPREYHGTALLLPDGRVVESGMGADFGNVPDEKSAEFYSPPYLFKGARPTISQAPTQITYGQSFFVGTPDGATIKSAVLIRTGAPTHFFDQSTQFVPVTIQQATGGLTAQAPSGANLAPPGYYMLFIINANGVPSVAPFVQLQ